MKRKHKKAKRLIQKDKKDATSEELIKEIKDIIEESLLDKVLIKDDIPLDKRKVIAINKMLTMKFRKLNE